MSSAASVPCFHCGNPVLQGGETTAEVNGVTQRFCCAGCEMAAKFIVTQGLERFYLFREAFSLEPAAPQRDWSVYDRDAALRRYTHLRSDGAREVTVQLQGMHCGACVWLVHNSLERLRGVLDVTVNLAEARAHITFAPARTSLSTLLATLHRLGLTPLPITYLRDADESGNEKRMALKRLAVAGFGMMQVMTFAVCLYAGAMDGIAPGMERLLRYVSLIVSTPVVFYSAQPFFVAAGRGLRTRVLGMDMPVAISIGAAYAWSVWATVRGQGTVYFDSVVMFTFFLLLGRYVEMALRHRVGQQKDSLRRLLPESAMRVVGESTQRVTPEELQAGDRIRILAGERVPADGVIAQGTSDVDESLLTGESLPRVCRVGEPVTAGTLNLSGVLEVAVTRVGPDSTLATVSRLLDRAQAARPAVADLADRVAAWFVAAILLLSAGVGLYWWHAGSEHAFATVLAVLVVTCPCALSLATPAALAAATARLARTGLLVTRTRALERLAHVDRAVFDKTGTLTQGQPAVEGVTVFDGRTPPGRCLAIASALECHSNHPIARAFAATLPIPGVSSVEVAPGRGIAGRLGTRRLRIGTLEYVSEGCSGVQPIARRAVTASKDHPSIFLADQEGLLAQIEFSDALRPDAAKTIGALHRLGLTTQIASGDREQVVASCARRLNIGEAQAELTAADKFVLVHSLQRAGRRVVMVGDGINDAPVLAAADVSVAIAAGADLARVSADIVMLGEGLMGLAEGVMTARRMLRIIRQNLAWALIYNLTAVPLAAIGWLEPWMAAVGMSASSLFVVLNALRILPGARRRPRAAPVVVVEEAAHA